MMARVSFACLLLTILICCDISHGLKEYEVSEKDGKCPPAIEIGICRKICSSDSECHADSKCCPTSCGGTICSIPVTPRLLKSEKSGKCPSPSLTRWVCSSRCSSDEDCKKDMKCCKTKCGALGCMTPVL